MEIEDVVKDLCYFFGLSEDEVVRFYETNPELLWGQNGLVYLGFRISFILGGNDEARAWLNAPARYLNGVTPLEKIKQGDFSSAHACLEALASGVSL